jgi:phage shock protein C
MKKLYRSRENKIIAGIIGGLGEYSDIDPTILRVIWLTLTTITGVIPGLTIYFIAILIIPKKPKENNS